jgi:hypothetical protein
MVAPLVKASPIIYAAITNHGFGHATRMAAVLAEIQRRCPSVLLFVVTTAPRWLLESYLPGEFIQRPRTLDVGVIQRDGITMDKAATLAQLQAIKSRQTQIIAGEVNFIHQNRVQLVLADIPPLAATIAHQAQVPGWMISNFGWDFIYRAWGGPFTEIADWMGDCFSRCDRLFRLPFHEPMAAFPQITDVGLTGGSPRHSPDQLRQAFAIETAPDQTVLLTFGGLGLQQIPYGNLAHFPQWQFITFDAQAPDLPNLCKVTDHAYRPVDFMPLCDRIISKPGYGTFSEACRLGTGIVTITREGFAETPLLLQGIPALVPHRILAPDAFFQGDWQFLREPLIPPHRTAPTSDSTIDQTNGALALETIGGDGNATIAQGVVEYLTAL